MSNGPLLLPAMLIWANWQPAIDVFGLNDHKFRAIRRRQKEVFVDFLQRLCISAIALRDWPGFVDLLICKQSGNIPWYNICAAFRRDQVVFGVYLNFFKLVSSIPGNRFTTTARNH